MHIVGRSVWGQHHRSRQPGSDAPAAGGRQQRQDQRQQPLQPGQQDQQQQDQQNQPDQQGQPPGEDGDQQGDPGVAANLQQVQQLLDGINALLPLDGPGAALRAPLAAAGGY